MKGIAASAHTGRLYVTDVSTAMALDLTNDRRILGTRRSRGP